MEYFKYWLETIKNRKRLLIAPVLMSIIVCFYWGMNEGVDTAYNKISTDKVFSVYEGNMSCPIASLVPEKYVSTLEGIEGVDMVSPEIRQNTSLLKDFVPVTILGVYPDKFRELKNIDINEEQWQNFKNNKKGVIIGKKLAKAIEDKFGGLTNDYRIPFVVEGVFDLPFSLLNNMMITHKDFLNQHVYKEDNVTVINLRFKPGLDSAKMSETVEAELAKNDTNLICRPEHQVWERTRVGIAQFSEHVIWYGLFILFLFLLRFIIVSKTYIENSRKREETFIGKYPNANPLFLRLVNISLTTLIGSSLGCLIAFFLFIKNPAPNGVDIFHPIIFVNLNVILKVVLSFVVAGIISAILGHIYHQRLEEKKFSKVSVLCLAVIPVFIMIIIINFFFSGPVKIRERLLNTGDPNSIIIVQEGAAMRNFSNIPAEVTEILKVIPDVEEKGETKLVSPVIHLSAIVEEEHVIVIGVDRNTFFDIESKIHFSEGDRPKNKNEIAVGRVVEQKLHRKLKIGEILEYEGAKWKISGIFESESILEDYIVTGYEDLAEATGRETLQYAVLKVKDMKHFNDLKANFKKYYGMLKGELPDLPEVKVYNENLHSRVTADQFFGLFRMGAIMTLVTIIVVFSLMKSLYQSLMIIDPSLKTNKISYLSQILLCSFVAGIVGVSAAYWLGGLINFTIAFSTFNLQAVPILMLISLAVSLTVALIAAMMLLKQPENVQQ